jgi:hypothetical protein
MGIEDRIRRALSAELSELEPSEDAWSSIQHRALRGRRGSGIVSRGALSALAILISAGLFAALWLVFRPGEQVGPRPSAEAPEPHVLGQVSLPGEPQAIAAGAEGVWAAFPDPGTSCSTRLLRIDSESRRVVADLEIDLLVHSLAVGEGSLWAGGNSCVPGPSSVYDATLVRVDASTNTVGGATPIQSHALVGDVAVRDGVVWVGVELDLARSAGGVVRVDAGTSEVTVERTLDGPGGTLAVTENAVWTIERAESGQLPPASTLLRLDPRTLETTASIPLEGAGSFAADAGTVWLQSDAEVAVQFLADSAHEVKPHVSVPGGFAPFAVTTDGVWFLGEDNESGQPQVGFLNADERAVGAALALNEAPVTVAFDPARREIWLGNPDGTATQVATNPGPTSGEHDETALPQTVEVTCEDDTKLFTSTVARQADGVHFRVRNRSGAGLLFVRDLQDPYSSWSRGALAGQDFAEFTLPIPPGDVLVACLHPPVETLELPRDAFLPLRVVPADQEPSVGDVLEIRDQAGFLVATTGDLARRGGGSSARVAPLLSVQ